MGLPRYELNPVSASIGFSAEGIVRFALEDQIDLMTEVVVMWEKLSGLDFDDAGNMPLPGRSTFKVQERNPWQRPRLPGVLIINGGENLFRLFAGKIRVFCKDVDQLTESAGLGDSREESIFCAGAWCYRGDALTERIRILKTE